jgi:hypothetical protein
MKLIITLLMLIPFLTLSQLRVILGKDTIKIKDVSEIQKVIDSINTEQFKIYELQRKKIQDSIEEAAILEFKRAPTLYYIDTSYEYEKPFIYTNSEKKPDDELVNKHKHDSLVTFSYLNYDVLNKINTYRNKKLEIDSTSQSVFIEDELLEIVRKSKKGLLVKDEFENCQCDECVDEVIYYLSSYKRFWKRLTSDKTKYIYLSVSRNQNNLYISVFYRIRIFKLQRIIIVDLNK